MSIPELRVPIVADDRTLASAFQRARQRTAGFAREASGDLKKVEGAMAHLGDVSAQSLGRYSAAAGSLGSRLAALGVAGGAAAIAVGALGVALIPATQRVAETEKIMRRLEAVLQVTGHAIGLTASQINDIAEEMERATGRSADETRESAAALVTYTTLGAKNFERVLKVANEMSTIFGGALRENVDKVAQAVTNPLEGFQRLKDAGFQLADAELEVAERMVRIGDVAGAAEVVLRNLENQMGNASSAQSQGLTGAFDRAKISVENFFDGLAERSGIGPGVARILNSVADAADRLTQSMQRGDMASEVSAMNAELRRTEEQIAGIRDTLAKGGPAFVYEGPLKALESQAETLRADIERKSADARRQAEQAAEELDRVRAAEDEARRAATTEQVAARGKEIAEQLRGFETAQEKLARFRADLQQTREELARSLELGADPAVVEKAVADAEALYERQVAGIEKVIAAEDKRAARESSRLDGLDRAKRTLEERTEGLQREAEAIGLSAFEQDRAKAILELEIAAKREGIAVNQSFRDSIAGYAEAYAEAATRVREAQERQEAINALQQEFGQVAFDGVSSLIDGSKSLNEVLGDTAKRLADLVLQATLLGQGPLAGLFGTRPAQAGGVGGLLGAVFGIGGGGGTALAGLYHSGGVAGSPRSSRSVPASVFAGAPRYHGGGIAGDEVPAILQKGEIIVPRHMAAAMRGEGAGFGRGGGGAAVSLSFRNSYDFRGADPSMKAWLLAQLEQRDAALEGQITGRVAEIYRRGILG